MDRADSAVRLHARTRLLVGIVLLLHVSLPEDFRTAGHGTAANAELVRKE
jgi:hypothetical protein